MIMCFSWCYLKFAKVLRPMGFHGSNQVWLFATSYLSYLYVVSVPFLVTRCCFFDPARFVFVRRNVVCKKNVAAAVKARSWRKQT